MPAAARASVPKINEAELQQQIFEYLLWALPEDAVAFAIPNGGSRNKREAVNLKKTGTTAGVPDLAILYHGRAMFIEIKTSSGSLSKAQKHTIARIDRAGCPVVVCRSLDEVKAFLIYFNVPLRTESRSAEGIRRGFDAALADMVRGLPDDDLDRAIDGASA